MKIEHLNEAVELAKERAGHLKDIETLKSVEEIKVQFGERSLKLYPSECDFHATKAAIMKISEGAVAELERRAKQIGLAL